MDSDVTTGRTPALGQMISAWRQFADLPSWSALSGQLGGLTESVCLIRLANDGVVIEHAGVQAVMAYGAPLASAPADALTPGRPDASGEAVEALSGGQPFTVEDTFGEGADERRIARLYLPLNETPPAVACGVVRIG
jgi:hypothetical protein